MQLIKDTSFTINDDAYIMQVKKNFMDKVNLDYFIHKYQKEFLLLVSSKDSNGTFSKEIAQNYEIELESLETQNLYVKHINKQKEIVNKLNNHIANLEKKIHKIVLEQEKAITKTYLIRDLFLHFQGHQLTDKYIYNNKGIYPVYSGSSNEIKGYMNEALFYEKDKIPCIIYQTKGNNEFKSKVVNHLFNANNTAVLMLKKSKKQIVNINYINMILALNMKLSISSKEGVSYIDTKILNSEIILPNLQLQNEIYAEYEKLINFKTKLENILQKLSA